jgi:hypothetical protein
MEPEEKGFHYFAVPAGNMQAAVNQNDSHGH